MFSLFYFLSSSLCLTLSSLPPGELFHAPNDKDLCVQVAKRAKRDYLAMYPNIAHEVCLNNFKFKKQTNKKGGASWRVIDIFFFRDKICALSLGFVLINFYFNYFLFLFFCFL